MRKRIARPEPVGLTTLPREEALACRGGFEDPFKKLLDWVLGNPPPPDQWPPEHL